jgi:heterotetrameric sarcosine oxidase gamma subunit
MCVAESMIANTATRIVKPEQEANGARNELLVVSEIFDRGVVHLAGRLSAFDGLHLPEKPNTCASHAATLAAWLGPDRWMLIGTPADARRWIALQSSSAAIADLSHGRHIIRVTGHGWRKLVSHGCPLDAAAIFKAGQWSCAQSLFSEVPVLMCTPPELTFVELYTPSSYGEYLRDMLKMSAQT